MYGLHYREELDETTAKEFDAFLARLKSVFLLEHDEDGHHTFDFNDEDTIQAMIDAAQAKGQWWKTGPWMWDDPTSVNPRKVNLRFTLAAGTYNDYAPTGIDGCIGISIDPSGGNVTLNGLKALNNYPQARTRILVIENIDGGSATITLAHDASGSVGDFRFDLPGGEDVVLDPGQNVWLKYDPIDLRWRGFITGQASGGIISSTGGGSGLREATLTISRADMAAWSTVPLTIITASAGQIIVPVQLTTHYYQHTGGGQWLTSYSISLRYSGNVQELMLSQTIIPSSGAPATDDFTTINAATTNLNYTSSGFNPVNKDLVVKGSSNPNVGEGNASDFIEVVLKYILVTVP